MSLSFPNHPFLTGAWEPWPMEGEARDLVIDGELPKELAGTLYRNGPNQQYAPRDEYHPFSGDGMVHAFKIEDGRCHYRNRWVRTPRFNLERDAGESLFCGFSNPMMSDPRTKGVPGGPSNTNVIWHGGRLLSLVEGGLPPVELDPETLETIGVHDFDGELTRPMDPDVAELMGTELREGRAPGIFTAHPKVDPDTGEMLGFGYSVFAPFLTYYVVSADGRLVRTEEIEVPFPAMVHDFITTAEHVIFPLFPATMRVERAAKGESVLKWEPELGTKVGVMPRDGTSDDVVWIDADPSFVFHPMNAHTDGRKITAEMSQFVTFPLGEAPPGGNPSTLTRWHIDLDAKTVRYEQLDDAEVEFPRVDERRTGLRNRFGFCAGSGDAMRGMSDLLRYDLESGRSDVHHLGEHAASSEPVFVPRTDDAPEGDGFLLSVVYRGAERRSDLVVLDAQNLADAPLATVKLPHRVPAGFHGNWRPA
ncbi:MAG: carotenoid oxygenase family protein [Candidatus Binatia bacterium]|nr:carotenoid oxygenase family protein [Candidatus Binatia bacterium]